MKEEKHPHNQKRLSENLQNLHLASQIGGNPVIVNTKINVFIHKHGRYRAV